MTVHLTWSSGTASSLRLAGLTDLLRASDDPLDIGPVEPLGAEGSNERRAAFWTDLDVVIPDRAAAYVGHQRDRYAHNQLDLDPTADHGFVLWWGPTLAEALFAIRIVESFVQAGALERLLVIDLSQAGRAPLSTWTAASLAPHIGAARSLPVGEGERWAAASRPFGAGDGAAFAAAARAPLDRVASHRTGRNGWSRVDTELLRLVSSLSARDTSRVVGATMHASLTDGDPVGDLVLLWRLRVLESAGVVQLSGEEWVANPMGALPPLPPIGQCWRVPL